jgi:hypothetical protein
MRLCRLMFFFMLELKIVHFFSILVGVLDQNVLFFLFSTFNLENYCQCQIFPRSQYQKEVVGEKLEILNYQTRKSDVWFGL